MATALTSTHWRLRFKPGEPLDWSASTESSEMRQLVNRRDLIFAQQRKADIPALQARSDELADKAMRKVDLIRQTRDLDAYKRFCMAANVPPYPVTDAMVALVVFARASQESGPIQTFRDNLARTKRATDFVWTAIEGIKNSVSVEADVNALKAFVRERTSKAAKSRRPSAPRAAPWHRSAPSKKRRRPTSSSSDTSSDTSSDASSDTSSDDDDDDNDDDKRIIRQRSAVGKGCERAPSNVKPAASTPSRFKRIKLSHETSPARCKPLIPPSALSLSTSHAPIHRLAPAQHTAPSSPAQAKLASHDVAAFLRGFDPTLVALAPVLISAGVSSVRDLAALAQLETTTLRLFFDDLAQQPALYSEPAASIELLWVFEGKLREVARQSWSR